MDLKGEAILLTEMVKAKKGSGRGGRGGRSGGRQAPAPAPAPAHHPGTGATPFFANSSRGNSVLNLSTLGGAPTVRSIEIADGPGEGHFTEALAKALGPRAKDPTARKQIVSLVSTLEPEAAHSGFQDPGNLDTGTAAILALLQQNSSAIQSAAYTTTGPGKRHCSQYGSLTVLRLCPPWISFVKATDDGLIV